MQNKIDNMVRVALASALRKVADEIDDGQPKGRAAWPKLKPVAQQGHGCADVYIAGCSALRGLALRLQIPIFKIGTTQQQLLIRQSDLCADRYGAASWLSGKLIAERGFDDWEMCQLSPIDVSGSGIAFVPRALRVNLTMAFGAFETALRGALRPHALRTWASSTTGRDHLKAIGVEESVALRYTLYGFGDQVRSSPCNELYVLRPRVDMLTICKAVGVALSAGAPQQVANLICQPNAISLTS